MDRYPRVLRYLIWLLFAFALVTALVITKELLVPLLLSILFSYLLYPAAARLERLGIPRIATNFISIIGALAIVMAIIYGIGLLISAFMNDLPAIQKNFNKNIAYFRLFLDENLGITGAHLNSLTESIRQSGTYALQFFSGTAQTILTIGLIPVYTFLLLFYRNKFRTFISMLVRDDQEKVTQNVIDQAAEVVPKYLKGLFVVCIILVLINTLGFYLIGIKYALLLGTIAALFNLIPYLGTVIGYMVVFLFVLATQSLSLSLGVVIQFFIVQFLENNILTPNITGTYVQINPLVTIISLIAAGMVWGLPGMFIVIPYLAMFKIVCENVEELKPVGFLLGTSGTERHAITISSLKKRFGWDQE